MMEVIAYRKRKIAAQVLMRVHVQRVKQALMFARRK